MKRITEVHAEQRGMIMGVLDSWKVKARVVTNYGKHGSNDPYHSVIVAPGETLPNFLREVAIMVDWEMTVAELVQTIKSHGLNPKDLTYGHVSERGFCIWPNRVETFLALNPYFP